MAGGSAGKRMRSRCKPLGQWRLAVLTAALVAVVVDLVAPAAGQDHIRIVGASTLQPFPADDAGGIDRGRRPAAGTSQRSE
jgi:hypothetical protein